MNLSANTYFEKCQENPDALRLSEMNSVLKLEVIKDKIVGGELLGAPWESSSLRLSDLSLIFRFPKSLSHAFPLHWLQFFRSNKRLWGWKHHHVSEWSADSGELSLEGGEEYSVHIQEKVCKCACVCFLIVSSHHSHSHQRDL